jgi:hypothetical protein
MLTNKFCFLNFFSMLNSFTQYRSYAPGFGAVGHFFSVVGQRKGPSAMVLKNALGELIVG